MKTIYRMISLLAIFVLLNVGIVGASSGNPTFGNNTTINDRPLKVLPSEQDITTFVNASTAHDNVTLENEIIANHPDWYFDTYYITTTKGDSYEVTVLYTNDPNGKGGYGRIGVYGDGKELYYVTPQPMVLCRPLVLDQVHGSCRMVTATLDNYKIVRSYLGNEGQQNIQPIETVKKDNNSCVIPKETEAPAIVENETATITDNSMNSVQAPVNNTHVQVENLGNNGTINQQIAGGNIWNNIKIYAQNIYVSIVGK